MMFLLQEYKQILILLIFSIFLACLILTLSYSFSVSNPDSEKLSAYECGFDPYEDARNTFDIRFYIIAILFLIFDLEAAFFFPWCISFSCLNTIGFYGMVDFIFELLVGFIYAWLIGGLEWEVGQKGYAVKKI
jgi:NADH-quinone oxidoreductase subunit A